MKKTVKKGMVVTLSACMLANSVPLSTVIDLNTA